MRVIKCIVVDDEPLARKVVIDYLERLEEFELVSSFKNGLEAKKFLESNNVDVIYLDINMPLLTGLELVRNFNLGAQVVFTTAYPDFAVEAFEYNSFDYLVKPISFERFLNSSERIKKYFREQTHSEKQASNLILKENKRYYKLSQDKILFVQAYGDYVKVITEKKTYVTKEKLRSLSNQLGHVFTQCHRSFFINLDHIDYIEGNHIVIQNEKIPISAKYKEVLFQRFNDR